MSQRTETHDRRAKATGDDIDDLQHRQPERKQDARPRYPVGQSSDGGDANPDEPADDEFELEGGDDLSAADLGPAAPGFADPDAPSGRTKKITRRPSA